MKSLRGKSAKKWVSIAAAGVLLLLLAFINPFWMFEYRIEDMSFQRPGIPNPNQTAQKLITKRQVAQKYFT